VEPVFRIGITAEFAVNGGGIVEGERKAVVLGAQALGFPEGGFELAERGDVGALTFESVPAVEVKFPDRLSG
jgi:hypothetical protein